MNPEEHAMNQQINMGDSQLAASNLQLAQQEMMLEGQQTSMIKEQLDLTQELDRIEYLLKGHIRVKNKQGVFEWVAPKDKNVVVFSEYGVQKIINIINWYVNKNTLLSNFEDEMILQKMEDFATSLADNIFMKYELFFELPTLDECKDELEARIKKRTEVKMFAHELTGSKGNEKEIREKVIKELEPIIEKELEKIRAKLLKDKLKDFDMIMRAIQDTVHSTYQRAWKGQERRSIRQHMHITENVNPNYSQDKKKGGFLGMFNK